MEFNLYLPKKMVPHLQNVASAGNWRTILFISGDTINITKFTKEWDRHLSKVFHTSEPHSHLFWFTTKGGVYFTVSGCKVIHDLFSSYVGEALRKGWVEKLDVAYSGRALAQFVKALTLALTQYYKYPGKTIRSFSGSISK